MKFFNAIVSGLAATNAYKSFPAQSSRISCPTPYTNNNNTTKATDATKSSAKTKPIQMPNNPAIDSPKDKKDDSSRPNFYHIF